MSTALRRLLRRRDARVFAAVLIATLALIVGLAHSGAGSEHMGKAAAVCLAIGIAGVALATMPHLGRHVPRPSRPGHQPTRAVLLVVAVASPHPRARGHPSLLQVFRR